MYYIVDSDEDLKFNDVDTLCDYLFDQDTYDDDDDLDQWINDCYRGCEIAGVDFDAAEIVRELSYDTYCDLRNEWKDSQSENDRDYYYSELENMDPGSETWVRNWKVECFSDNEKEIEEEKKEIEAFNALLQVSYTVKTISDAPMNVQIIR